jgi:hypothetical protein
VLQEVVVHDASSSLNLKDSLGQSVHTVGIKVLLQTPITSKQNWNLDSLFSSFAGLDREASGLKGRSDNPEDGVARQVMLCGRYVRLMPTKGFDDLFQVLWKAV